MRKLTSQNKLLSMNSSSSIDPSSWVINIRNFFSEKDIEDETDIHNNTNNVYVYTVPKSLRAFKPEAYSPQTIALGPYHHLRQDLYEMSMYKAICAKMMQNELKELKFEDLVHKLVRKDLKIRGCYHMYLDIDKEALAWMMAIDGFFLLEFLQAYVNKYVISSSNNSSKPKISILENLIGTKSSCISIINDILMLENQIPMFVLKKIIKLQCSSFDSVEDLLVQMLMSVCKEVSPLMLNKNYPTLEAMKCAHLLDLLYHLMVPKLEQSSEDQEVQEEEISKDVEQDNEENLSAAIEENKEVLTETLDKLQAFKVFTKFLSLKPFKVLAQLPLKVILKLPIVSAMGPILEGMLRGNDKGSNTVDGSSQKDDRQAILVEEITIPSVGDLFDAGVEFRATNGDISTIKFDKKLKIFYLPVVHVDANTEVLMRNLVAFEASSSRQLILARFCELMNGIIDTPKDVQILRKKKILTSSLRRDEEVANLWNGMTKAIRLSKVPFIDEAIKDVNGYYNNTFKMKFQRLMRRYVYNSWRILVVLATLILLGLMGLQSFCTVYSCPRFFNIDVAAISSATPE